MCVYNEIKQTQIRLQVKSAFFYTAAHSHQIFIGIDWRSQLIHEYPINNDERHTKRHSTVLCIHCMTRKPAAFFHHLLSLERISLSKYKKCAMSIHLIVLSLALSFTHSMSQSLSLSFSAFLSILLLIHSSHNNYRLDASCVLEYSTHLSTRRLAVHAYEQFCCCCSPSYFFSDFDVCESLKTNGMLR